MTESLALRYRPRRLPDVCGQTPVAAVLYQMAVRRKVPEALLFTGHHGAGKTSTARILAAMLNCEEPPGPAGEWPCGACASCKAIADGSSPDVIEVDAASNGGVTEIRKIKDLVQYASTGLYHVILLDEAHSMSKDAFNALLKVLEEPPENTIFVLLTTEPGRILSTVASRCMQFSFRRLSPAVIAQRLAWICEQEEKAADAALLREIAERADGAMRDAVVALDQVLRAGVSSPAMYRQLMGDPDFGPALLLAIASGNYAAMFGKLDEVLAEHGDYQLVASRLVSCLRDLLVLHCKGALPAQGEALAARQALAGQLDTGRVAAAMRVLWEFRTRVARTDPRSGLELAVVMVAERLAARAPGGQAPTQALAPGTGAGPMSPERLAQLAGQR